MKKYFLLTLLTLAFLSCEKEIPVYTVTVSSSPSEGGSVSPEGGEYQEGQTASFTATPNEFYGFAGWSGADNSAINPISIIVDTNKSLTARFEKLDTDNDGVTDDIDQCPDTPESEQADSNGCSVSQKDFELTISVEGEGSVTEELLIAPAMYKGTSQVRLIAVPVEGWELTEWTGDASGNENPLIIDIVGTTNITAIFTKKDTDGDGVPDLEDSCADTPEGEEADENGCSLSQKEFELTVTTEGEGTVTEELIVSPTIYQGTSEVKLTAVPAEGWELIEWTGDATGSENPITIEIDGAKSITAVFAKKDTDGDGVPDLDDLCEDTPEGEEADENGCSLSQKDSDDDGVTDDIDQCPDTPEGEEADENGCALSQKDSDNDGVTDDIDECPDTEEGVAVYETGCTIPPIFLSENGVTIQCPTAKIGEIYEFDGKTYEIVDNQTIRTTSFLRDEDPNTCVCTTQVTDMGLTEENTFLWNYHEEIIRSFQEDIGDWDVSNVTDMSYLFYMYPSSNWSGINEVDLSNWDTSSVKNMDRMFYRNEEFNIDISNWDVSSVENMYYMFYNAHYFNQPLNNWDVSKVKNMEGMFYGAQSFNQPLNNWEVSNVTNMERMFSSAYKFNGDISSWDVSSVRNMNYMFSYSYVNGRFVESITGEGPDFNVDISNWNVSNVQSMISMFYYAVRFNQDISNWDVSNVIDIRYMFSGALRFNQPVGNWDISNVTQIYGLFSNAKSFNQPLNNWDISRFTSLENMFGGAESFNQPLDNWDVSNITNMSNMFKGAISFNQNISNWDVSSVVNMENMLSGTDSFNADITSWDVSSVENMKGLFTGNNTFNQNISSWNVSNVTNMENMFSGADVFNQDISSWNVSSVKNMEGMFRRAYEFNQDIGGWDVSNVVNMDQMFYVARTFNQDLTSWCVYDVFQPDRFSSNSALNQDFLPIWGTCPPNKSNIEISKYSESKSCINGVCDATLGLTISNSSEETINVTKIEKWVNESLNTTYTSGDVFGDLESGASKSFSMTLNSATSGQIKVFWSFGNKNYVAIYNWTP